MTAIDDLKIIDGFFDGDRFIMRGISGHVVNGVYRAYGLRSMARLVLEGEPLSLVIDKECTIHVPVELNGQLKQELFMIADELG